MVINIVHYHTHPGGIVTAYVQKELQSIQPSLEVLR